MISSAQALGTDKLSNAIAESAKTEAWVVNLFILSAFSEGLEILDDRHGIGLRPSNVLSIVELYLAD
jgi:hypothetical protein